MPYRILLATLILVLLSCSAKASDEDAGPREIGQPQALAGSMVSSELSQDYVGPGMVSDNDEAIIFSTGELVIVPDHLNRGMMVSQQSGSTTPPFTITSELCRNGQGPDCTVLRLGDDYLTTSSPSKGYLYSCSEKNPNAPGSREGKITWIDFPAKTWNFLKKLWLPGGAFTTEHGIYMENLSEDNRNIEVNNLPLDGNIGDWPMTNYPHLTSIDGNPGVPAPRKLSFSYPMNPEIATSPACLPLGAIGVTKNGIIIFNAADGRGEDAVAREIVDEFGGHPAMSDYHYHFIPERLDHKSLEDGHSGIVGYINDGFAIYGYKGEGGLEMSNYDLDACHGHAHGKLGYHYHATIEYPYTVGCYMGDPISNILGSNSRSGRYI